MQYDLFISYSRKDNVTNMFTELNERIEAEYVEFTEVGLECLIDKDELYGKGGYFPLVVTVIKRIGENYHCQFFKYFA